MEKEGLRRSVDLLEESGVKLDCVVTDRRPQIRQFLKDRKINHRYDVWRTVKGDAASLLSENTFHRIPTGHGSSGIFKTSIPDSESQGILYLCCPSHGISGNFF